MSDSIRIRDELLEDVEFGPNDIGVTGPEQLAWDPDVGFLVARNTTLGGAGLVGFGVPYLPRSRMSNPDGPPEFDERSRFSPLTTYDEVPRPLQNGGHLSKGVGGRLCTDKGTAWSGRDVDGPVGLYHVGIPLARWLDIRGNQGSHARQIIQHAGHRAVAALMGARFATQGVHAKYDDAIRRDTNGQYRRAAAVCMTVPPRGQAALKRDGIVAPEGVEQAFVILRDPGLTVRRLGTVNISKPER